MFLWAKMNSVLDMDIIIEGAKMFQGEALNDYVAGSGVATVSEEVMPNAYQRQAVPGTSGEIIIEIIDKAVPGTSGEIIMEIIDKEDGGNGAQAN
jgi:hypothetical protein